ncbi:MAG: DinB family protein [Chloroflexota bacterium]|nr:MAG: DinB family protein [Chloroflexota bacterium]
MINVSEQWNPKQALLKEYLSRRDKFDEAIKLCLEMHSLVHTSEMSSSTVRTYEDDLWDGLNEQVFRWIQENGKPTIAWNSWHMTRIEDITSNILIADDSQVLNNEWSRKLNSEILDTGNAMTVKEIEDFSNRVNMRELRSYRIAVGRRTQIIIEQLKSDDLKRKMTSRQLKRIVSEGGVLDVEGSRWLIDFWGRKTVSGILLMPITRHQIVHLNDSLKMKEKYAKGIPK